MVPVASRVSSKQTPRILVRMTTPVSYRTQPPKLLGGLLCLDFLNTVSWRGDRREPGERLTGYTELVYWASRVRILDAGSARRLLGSAKRQPATADAVLARAIELREALARLLSAGKDRAHGDVAIVNALLSAAPPRVALRARNSCYAWTDEESEESLDSPLHPVVWSAADLLTSTQLRNVRSCAETRCGWFFLDASPGGNRRWCSMRECGNRAKARRHYREARS
jgi:predicted RNA-binding Zn ribbon-like protein